MLLTKLHTEKAVTPDQLEYIYSLAPRRSVGGENGTPGNYCLRMRVIKRLLLRNTTAVTNLMGWVSVVT